MQTFEMKQHFSKCSTGQKKEFTKDTELFQS